MEWDKGYSYLVKFFEQNGHAIISTEYIAEDDFDGWVKSGIFDVTISSLLIPGLNGKWGVLGYLSEEEEVVLLVSSSLADIFFDVEWWSVVLLFFLSWIQNTNR
mgnify:CR=1 FL=1